MSYVEIVMTQELAGVSLQNRFYYYNGVYNAYATELNLLADSFENEVLAAYEAIQSTQITTTSLYLRSLNTGAVVTRVEAVAGDVVATLAETIQPDLALLIRLGVGQSINVATDAPYVGARSIRYGKKYISGLTEDWMGASGYEVPAALATAWASFLAAMEEPLTGTGANDHTPIVLGFILPALPPSGLYPDGQPEAPPRRAPITSAAATRFTRLRSRLN